MTDAHYDFTDRTVIVTGAGRGIGRAIVERFVTAGAHVVGVELDPEAAEELRSDLGVVCETADVAVTADVERVVAAAVERTGRIDVLVNNAGLLRDKVLWRLTDEEWDLVLAVHLGGAFRFTRACVPHFRERSYGRIVNVTSYTGLHGNAGQSAYSAAKAGVIGLTKTTAKELARFGVTANAISPNAATRMIDSIPAPQRAEVEKLIPLGRFAEPQEITAAVAFLASESAGYVTGTVLPVDGGIAM